MIAVASSDMKFADIFRKLANPPPSESQAFGLAKIDKNVRLKWENVGSYLLERTLSTSFQHRFISFCLKPTDESWKNVSASTSVESTFFEASSSSEQTLGLWNAFRRSHRLRINCYNFRNAEWFSR